jgi:hypothetical protein
MGEHKYSFIPCENFSLVVKTTKNLNIKTLKPRIETLKNSFEEKYALDLAKNNFDPEIYNGFEKVVEDTFGIREKPKFKSSELFQDLLGLKGKKVNFKKVLNSL